VSETRTNTAIEVSLPGKIMLAGEYAVLAGGHALAVTINRRLAVRVSPSPATQDGATDIRVSSNLWTAPKILTRAQIAGKEQAPDDMLLQAVAAAAVRHQIWPETVDVRSELDVTQGVGSSSALRLGTLVAFAALRRGRELTSTELDEEMRAAIVLQREAQGGLASGYDIATQAHGGVVLFVPDTFLARRFSNDSLARCSRFLRVMIGGRGAPTTAVMARAKSAIDSAEKGEQIRRTSTDFIAALHQHFEGPAASTTDLGELISTCRDFREALAGLPDFPRELAQELAQLPGCDAPQHEHGFSWKTTGAGGEDAILLIGSDANTARARDALQRLGWRDAEFAFDDTGLKTQWTPASVHRAHPATPAETLKSAALLGPTCTATVPSNIAFLKYWGKLDAGAQWPANDSLSMTLSQSRTITAATRIDAALDEVLLSSNRLASSAPFAQRVTQHLDLIRATLGVDARFSINTHNTFPAACGIASSASGFGALTLAAIAACTGAESLDDLNIAGFSAARLAGIARMGSGSACRSFHGGFVRWSKGDSPREQDITQIARETDWQLSDLIVIISDAEKSVSSRGGHAAAFTSPLMLPRLAGSKERLAAMTTAIAQRDLARLGELIEQDALDMHAVMLSSTPPAAYIGPETADFLGWVRRRRQTGELRAWFTLDAGPNVHLLCAAEDTRETLALIRAEWGHALRIIEDHTGGGPTLSVASDRFAGVEQPLTKPVAGLTTDA